jgi:hypothetical protein
MTCNIKNIELAINTQYDVLFIDLSYYIFHRYHAYINWYQLSKEVKLTEDNIHEEFTKKENIEHFKKLCISKLEEFKKKYKIKDNNNIYLLKDCPRNEIWRNDLINDYKGTRIQDRFVKSFFVEGMKEVIDNSNYQVISYATLEADDLAYISIKNLKENKELKFERKIIVVTKDSDYIQLLKFNNLEIIDAHKKDISVRLKSSSIEGFLKLKIMNGDISDNIKGIFNDLPNKKIYDPIQKKEIKVTKKIIEELSENEQLFDRLIKNNKENGIYDKYLHNKKLIDFSEIPEKFHHIVKYKAL